jgi:hypothetical protein
MAYQQAEDVGDSLQPFCVSGSTLNNQSWTATGGDPPLRGLGTGLIINHKNELGYYEILQRHELSGLDGFQ